MSLRGAQYELRMEKLELAGQMLAKETTMSVERDDLTHNRFADVGSNGKSNDNLVDKPRCGASCNLCVASHCVVAAA